MRFWFSTAPTAEMSLQNGSTGAQRPESEPDVGPEIGNSFLEGEKSLQARRSEARVEHARGKQAMRMRKDSSGEAGNVLLECGSTGITAMWHRGRFSTPRQSRKSRAAEWL